MHGMSEEIDSCYALTKHCRESEHSKVCAGCHDAGTIWHFDLDGYRRHLTEHNVCRKCERHFDTPSNMLPVSVNNTVSGLCCVIPNMSSMS